MYTLKITLRYPESYNEKCWYVEHTFNSKDECFNFLEEYYSPDINDPDSQYNFEFYKCKDCCIA